MLVRQVQPAMSLVMKRKSVILEACCIIIQPSDIEIPQVYNPERIQEATKEKKEKTVLSQTFNILF